MKKAYRFDKLSVLTILAAVALALAPLFGRLSDTDAAPSDGGSIAIPGCETLSLAAGRTRQSVRIENPKGNPCYFRVSLLLSDGETLWTSRLMKPGKSISRLTLSHSLDAGEYGATLKYDCFSLKDKFPLNGAEIKVTIEVK